MDNGETTNARGAGLVTYADVEAAAARLAGHARRTPVLTSRTVDERVGAHVYFKHEGFQRTGSFKFRGAFNALSCLPKEQKGRGVVTYSSGNHAQAVALAGKLLGVPATIVMPHDAPEVKLAATRGYGAEVLLYDRAEKRREEVGAVLASERGLALVPPYDHPDVVAGQGTIGLEIVEQRPDVAAVLSPVSGGGLLAGIAVAVSALRPGTRVVAVEPSGAAKLSAALAAGEPRTLERTESIADGLLTRSIGSLTFPLIRRVVREVVQVAEDEIAAAVRFLYREAGLRVEPSGAVTTAAVLAGRVRLDGPTVLVVSGGNVDPQLFQRLAE
jgi:threo-3-hydroxy-L-aspartate ammonia-lyase